LFEKLHSTSQYKIVEETANGRRYCFYCDVSKTAVFTTGPVRADSPETELLLAWGQARSYFNGCSECGRWIRDEAYNIDEMKCIECAPNKIIPRFCTDCGSPLESGTDRCPRCGRQLGNRVAAG